MLEEEEKLIQLAKEGKVGSFDKLYDHYLPPIYRFIYMKVSHRQETEDLTHEVFLTAWQNITRYELRGFPFSSWLYQIARNRIIDYYRVKKKNIELDNPSTDQNQFKVEAVVEKEIDNNLTMEVVRRALKKLTHNQQDVVLMRFMEDMSPREIAIILNKTEGAVRLIQHRAINELKKFLNLE